ncbi:MAG: restriction endonuclease subunit S [Methylotenera sp.]|nr:restriction endonuclease subunit S [Flavobacterium sp.]
MTTNLQTYNNYKPSGVEWLGDIPEHWEALSNKYIFNINKILVGKKSSDYDLLSLTLNGVIKRDMENPSGKFPAEFDTYQEVKKGDFIFCLFDVEETPRTVGLSDYDGMITGAYTVMQPYENFDRSFLYYFYLNLDADKRMKPLYTGLRNTISKDNFFSFKTYVPPKEEQSLIAQFLDDKNIKIEQAIIIKKKQIELLKERRQILIHKAVTKGLNPDAKLKESNVEWIGEIPEHWEVKRLASFGKFSKGGGFSKSDLTENGVSAILYGDIYTKYDIYIKNEVRFISEETAKKSIEIKKNSLLFTGSGETMEDIGKCVVYLNDGKAFAGGDVIIFEQSDNDSFFLSYALNTNGARFEKARFSKGEIIVHTYGSKLRDIYIPIPPKSEQVIIAEFLESISFKISTAISLKEKEIDKLKEYKASLINSAVTGKVKVF